MEEFLGAFDRGGMPMGGATLLGVIGLWVALERLTRLWTRLDVDGAWLFARVRGLVVAGDIAGALAQCRAVGCTAVARVLSAGLMRADLGRVGIAHALAEAREEQLIEVQRRRNLLSGLASVTILLGLLGTIFGMIERFVCVATVSADSRHQSLSLGISLAVYSTGLSLLIATPLLVAQIFVRDRVDKICAEVRLYAAKLQTVLWARLE